MLASCFALLFRIVRKNSGSWKNNHIGIILRLYGAKELLPYVYGWNRYIWKDKKSHALFWKFHEIHQKLFNESKFEIEIKGDR